MKKYIFSILAIVVASATVAFTIPGAHKKSVKLNTHDFYYLPSNPLDFSQNSVKDKQNWKSTGGEPDDCLGDADKACMISVDDTYTRDSSGTRVFNQTGALANIAVTPGAAGASTGYVPIQGSPSVGIAAKVDKQ